MLGCAFSTLDVMLIPGCYTCLFHIFSVIRFCSRLLLSYLKIIYCSVFMLLSTKRSVSVWLERKVHSGKFAQISLNFISFKSFCCKISWIISNLGYPAHTTIHLTMQGGHCSQARSINHLLCEYHCARLIWNDFHCSAPVKYSDRFGSTPAYLSSIVFVVRVPWLAVICVA